MIGTSLALRLIAFDEAALEPCAAIIRPPAAPGERQFYTARLGKPYPGTNLRLHTNKVSPSELPYSVRQLERHPRTCQAFIPLDVSRYVVLVVPTAQDGAPALRSAVAMIVPGDRGVVFAAGAWHAGATVLDRQGSFCVLQYRDDTAADDEFLALADPFDVRV